MPSSNSSADSDKTKLPELDNEGYLLDPSEWTKEIAELLAKQEDIKMTSDHWFVVNYIRDYFESYQSVPEFRKALKYVKENLDPKKATRKYIYSLFPYGYASQGCKIAGMRKPLKLMLDL